MDQAASGQPYLADLSKGRIVMGVATDGVAQVVLRIPATSLQDTFTVAVRPDQCLTSAAAGTNCVDEYGVVFDPTSPPSAALFTNAAIGPFTVKAVPTANGPMAFAAYRAPVDFVRSGTPNASDKVAAERSVFISLNNGALPDLSITLVRPPVVLIHGTFSDPSVFNGFTPLAPSRITVNSLFSINTLDYSADIDDLVDSTVPTYSPLTRFLRHIKRNVVSVASNASFLMPDLTTVIHSFKDNKLYNPVAIPVAAVEADVVAHSLGGLIARGMTHVGTTFPGVPFYGEKTYGQGYIHKLITLGTNFALRALDGTNACYIGLAALGDGAYNLLSLSILGDTYSGAVGDQVGDPTSGVTNQMLNFLNGSPPRLRTALIAAQFDADNNSPTIALTGLPTMEICGTKTALPDGSIVLGIVPGGMVIPGDFLADNYSFTNWPNIFNGKPSDVVIPFASATFGQQVAIDGRFMGRVHGPGSVGFGGIGFAGPHLLDPASNVPTAVLNLLNTSVRDSSHFFETP